MARLNRDKSKNNLPEKSKRNWLLLVNTALIIGLYILILIGEV